MNFKIISIIGLTILLHHLPLSASDVTFYSDVVFSANPALKKCLYRDRLNEKQLANYFEYLDKNQAFQDFSLKVSKSASEYSLNGYFECLLFRRALEQLYPEIALMQIHLLMYKYMSKRDYDVLLVKLKRDLGFFVASDDKVYKVQYIDIKDVRYYGVFDESKRGSTYRILFSSVGERKLSFSLKSVPTFKTPEFEVKELEYRWGGRNYTFEVKFNKTIISFLNDVPHLEIQDYFGLDLSPEVSRAVDEHLEKGVFATLKTEKEKTRFLLSLARTLSEYKTDDEAYGKPRPMFIEEALYYDYSDCEDKTVLFCWLIEKYIGKPYIVLLYPTHVNVAVKLSGRYKKTLAYKGQNFAICEPTNSADHLEIGECPRYNAESPPKMIYFFGIE